MRYKNQGFTIIEVLLVLSIAGVILVVVFLAVPAMQRNSRNYERKRVANLSLTQVVQYRTDTGKIPTTGSDGDAFIDNYLSNVPEHLQIVFRDNDAPHSDKPPLDQVYVQYGHWCTSSHGNPDTPGDIITSAPGSHDGNKYFSVYTRLEPNQYFCIDNG